MYNKTRRKPLGNQQWILLHTKTENYSTELHSSIVWAFMHTSRLKTKEPNLKELIQDKSMVYRQCVVFTSCLSPEMYTTLEKLGGVSGV